ncbi:putative amidoligase enzyme-domain-containing protein [Cladorrhinum sp. PSN332]|nr:putative amidoligase enzyme-domain-containing protein [Cladorrhinum sp. PSN332]
MSSINQTQLEPLTIGVELEFYVAHQKKGLEYAPGDNALPHKEGQAQAFAKIANEIQTATHEEVHNQHPSSSYWPPLTYEFYQKNWTVKDHEGVKKGRDQNYAWHDVEVSSPIMKLSEVASTLQTVLGRLNDAFRLSADRSCAFQVHIGCGSAGFSPLNVKKMATILWFAEGRLDQLYAPHRLYSKWAVGFDECRIGQDEQYMHSKPRSRRGHGASSDARAQYDYWLGSILEYRAEAGIITKERARRVRALWEEDDLEKLCGEMLVPKHMGGRMGVYYSEYCAAYSFYNFVHSRHDRQPPKRTIEFRRPEGTLNAAVATAWCHVFAAIVDYARAADREHYSGMVGKLSWTTAAYPTKEFLTDVGCRADHIQALWDKDNSAFNQPA